MLSLAGFLMQNRRNAILLALLFAIVPLMGWVADIIMALVTLRKGAKEGAIVLIWMLLPSLLLALKGQPQFLLYNVLAGSTVIYCFALVLRHTANWKDVLQLMVIIGVPEIIALHVLVPHLDSAWSRELLSYFEMLRQQLAAQAANSDMRYGAELLSKIIIGVQITVFFVYNLIILLLARYVQARLYNPAGLKPELYNIRLGIVSIIIFLLVGLTSLSGNNIAINCLLLALMPFMVAGISLVHCIAAMTKVSGFWFIGFYGLLIIFFSYCAVLLSVLALEDSWFNFRQRFKTQ